MLLQLWVADVVGGELESTRSLNNGIVRSVEIDGRVDEVAATELLAGDVDCAVFTVSQKD